MCFRHVAAAGCSMAAGITIDKITGHTTLPSQDAKLGLRRRATGCGASWASCWHHCTLSASIALGQLDAAPTLSTTLAGRVAGLLLL